MMVLKFVFFSWKVKKTSRFDLTSKRKTNPLLECKTKQLNPELRWQCSQRYFTLCSSPLSPSPTLSLFLSLTQMYQTSGGGFTMWRFSHDDKPRWARRASAHAFVSAVADVAMATPSCWRRGEMEGLRTGRRAAGTEGGGRVINQCLRSVAVPMSHGEVNGVGRRLLLSCGEGQLLLLLLWLSDTFLSLPLLKYLFSQLGFFSFFKFRPGSTLFFFWNQLYFI